jgi:FixJ family two-component response regulator
VRTPVISIVDDDASVRIATARLVGLHGFVAYGFASAEEFLQSPHLDETSCLITDMRMPGMSGADLRRYLVAHGQQIPTIFITAYREESAATEARASGAACYLTKPFDGETLIKCVYKALQRSPGAEGGERRH